MIYRGKRRPRWGRIALIGSLALLLIAGLIVGCGMIYYKQINDRVKRADPFSDMVGNRPVKAVDGAMNILMLGSDSRDPDNKDKAGQWRTDTMIIVHIPSSHDKAYFISIPRDLYVFIPKSKTDPQYGNTKAKINAAFSWGGLPLVVQTIEGFAGVRMDHVVLIDFAGFVNVTDALGGVDMNIDQAITSIHKPFRQFKKGMNHLDGEAALDYVRQRYQFADGDFSRMRHQQDFMKALMDKAVSSHTVTNPVKLNSFLKSVASSLTVDKEFSLADMALQFRGIRGGDLTFLVSPHLGSQTINGESVIVSDVAKATGLYKALKTDKMSSWITQGASPGVSQKSGN